MAQMYSPNDPSPDSVLLGVDLGLNHIRIATVDPEGHLMAFRREAYKEDSFQDAGILTGQIVSTIDQMVEEHSSKSPVRAIGVSFPGPVMHKGKTGLRSSHLPGLLENDFHGEISRTFGLPVRIENNATSAAYAEQLLGVAKGVDDWLYLHLGANVSAGLVLGGKLQFGKSGLAGGIGQMRIDPERVGDSVTLESMVSAENIVRRTRDRLQRDKTSSLSRLGAMGGFNYDDILTAAHSGDDLAKMMMQRTGAFIALALSDVISLLNLAMVAVGGAPAGRPFLVAAIINEARNRTYPPAFEECRIVEAELGAEAGAIGAALLAGT